jgi:hypothetical protein
MVASEPRKMTVVAPSAQGTLVETPLSHLLVYALDHRLEGTLVIEEPGQRRHAVYFSAGAPTIVHSADPVIRLGRSRRARSSRPSCVPAPRASCSGRP